MSLCGVAGARSHFVPLAEAKAWFRVCSSSINPSMPDAVISWVKLLR